MLDGAMVVVLAVVAEIPPLQNHEFLIHDM